MGTADGVEKRQRETVPKVQPIRRKRKLGPAKLRPFVDGHNAQIAGSETERVIQREEMKIAEAKANKRR